MVHCPYFLLLSREGNRGENSASGEAALQMMPIEMEIGRRKGVTFAINSIHWGKSAENLPICRFFFITLYIDRRRLSNKFPSKTRRLDTLYKMHPSQEGRLRRWV